MRKSWRYSPSLFSALKAESYRGATLSLLNKFVIDFSLLSRLVNSGANAEWLMDKVVEVCFRHEDARRSSWRSLVLFSLKKCLVAGMLRPHE